MPSSADMEKFVERIDQRLELLSSEKSQGAAGAAPQKSEDLDRIESKLDSIRKLLILLTDSGNPNE